MGKVKKYHYITSERTAEERESIIGIDEKKHQETMERFANEKPKEEVKFMDANFDPFEDRILVYPDSVETKTAGGLFVPDEVTNKAKPLRGTVVAFGPGKNGNSLPLTVGMKIYYGNYAGTEIELDNKIKYLIMRQADCFGK